MKKILIVEDDKSIKDNLSQYLKNEGYNVEKASDLSEARSIELSNVDLVILDWMLPDGQGIDFLKEIKNSHSYLIVIMLTARVEITDKVLGLEIGADDYMVKPFDPRELSARIRVQLRKNTEPKDDQYDIIEGKGVKIDLKSRSVLFKGKDIRLNRMEFDLLKFLLSRPGIVFSRQELLDEVWGMESFPTTRTVDQHVLSLRNKLSSDLIETLRGVGYRIK